MKHFICFLFILLCGCTHRPTITIQQDYPNYPPLVVANNLQSEFDAACLLFYVKFGCFKCHSVDKGRFIEKEFYTDNNNLYFSYGPAIHDLTYELTPDDITRIQQIYLFNLSLGVDTIVIQQDIAHFVMKPIVNDTLYCSFHIRPKENNRHASHYYVIGVSIPTDTIFYSYDGQFTYKIATWNYPSEYAKAKEDFWNCIDQYLHEEHQLPISPWLQKKIKER